MSKPGVGTTFGISSGDALIPAERHPACRRHEPRLDFGTEREDVAGDAKGKGASGSNREAESTDAQERGGLSRGSDEGPVMRLERGPLIWANWFAGRSPSFSGRRQPSRDGTSRMMREYQVRICERLGVKDSDARDVAYVYTGGAMKRRILADAHVHAPRSSRLAPEKVVREI